MDEVDKIIIHSLREIGCVIDEETTSISEFSPELVVRAAATCLHQIKPNLSLPKSLPAGMAQRFATATKLADECALCGYRGDIGYQSFLYPNTVDVRRLLMFLIEQLPKENQMTTTKPLDKMPKGVYELLRREIRDKIHQQMREPWVPQYARSVGNRRQSGCSSLHMPFVPQLNLNIPNSVEFLPKKVKAYLHQAPNVFQQTATKDYDLISTVLHRNAIDLHASETMAADTFKYSLLASTMTSQVTTPSTDMKSPPTASENRTELEKLKLLTPLKELNENVNTLKSQNEVLFAECKLMNSQIVVLKAEQVEVQAICEQLRSKAKVHERACLVLENPEENVEKLESLIRTTLVRRKTLDEQWQSYRQPLLQQLKELQKSKQANNSQNVADLREAIMQLENALHEKTDAHANLVTKLKNAEISAAPRKEYTRRILEFIGNIRKQRTDIYKVLDDTRDLQKQLNSVTAQLHRQFNYTDDLLFQSAKHDIHAKKAYKLLASLHATCNDLVELVTQTGNVSKEIRELEVQIDCERLKNIAHSLERISTDIANFESVIKNVQLEIRNIENNTHPG